MHEEFMNYALELSQQYKGTSLLNPHIGCIITNINNEIIGSGIHTIENSINSINYINSINSIYITLEPYAQSSIDILLKYKPNHIYIGIYNPDPQVYKKGCKILSDNGLNVTVGILNDKIIESLKYYIHYHETKSPFFTGKIAMYMNNVYRSGNADKLLIFNEKAQDDLNKLRTNCNGILVGSKTWALDNSYLNLVHKSKESSNYTIFVIDNNLQFAHTHTPEHTHHTKIIYVCFNPQYQDNVHNLSNVLFCKDLNDLKNKMYEKQIVHCLIEGGQITLNRFSTVMDEFIYYINFNYKNNINNINNEKVFDEMRFNFNRNLHIINTQNFDNIVKIICKTI